MKTLKTLLDKTNQSNVNNSLHQVLHIHFLRGFGSALIPEEANLLGVCGATGFEFEILDGRRTCTQHYRVCCTCNK